MWMWTCSCRRRSTAQRPFGPSAAEGIGFRKSDGQKARSLRSLPQDRIKAHGHTIISGCLGTTTLPTSNRLNEGLNDNHCSTRTIRKPRTDLRPPADGIPQLRTKQLLFNTIHLGSDPEILGRQEQKGQPCAAVEGSKEVRESYD